MLTVSGALAKSGILVRKMQALEALTMIDTVVFDKTGTLTHDRMTVGEITTNESLSLLEASHVAVALAQHSLHPVSRALVLANEHMSKASADFSITSVQEVSGFGLVADSSLGQLKLGSAKFCGLESDLSQPFSEDSDLNTSKVYLVSEKGWLASFEIIEAIKEDAVLAIKALQKNGLHVEVLSGDKRQSVERIAKMVGIVKAQGSCTPQDKLNHMQQLQQQGHHVAMVGDGLNDGPVLASAHVSIAMGQAVPLAQAQSDFVIMSGQLAMVPHLIAQAKRTMRIVKQNLLWAAGYNAICVPLAVAGMLPAWIAGLGMALSSLLVVLNAARLSSVAVPTL